MRDVNTLKRMGFDIWMHQQISPMPARFFSLSVKEHVGLLVLPEHTLSDSARITLKKMLQAFNMQCKKAYNLSRKQAFCLIFDPALTAAFTPALRIGIDNKTPIIDPHFGQLFIYPDLECVVTDIACKKQIWHDINAYLSG